MSAIVKEKTNDERDDQDRPNEVGTERVHISVFDRIGQKLFSRNVRRSKVLTLPNLNDSRSK